MRKPILIVGQQGCGKSTIAKLLSKSHKYKTNNVYDEVADVSRLDEIAEKGFSISCTQIPEVRIPIDTLLKFNVINFDCGI